MILFSSSDLVIYPDAQVEDRRPTVCSGGHSFPKGLQQTIHEPRGRKQQKSSPGFIQNALTLRPLGSLNTYVIPFPIGSHIHRERTQSTSPAWHHYCGQVMKRCLRRPLNFLALPPTLLVRGRTRIQTWSCHVCDSVTDSILLCPALPPLL